MADIVNLNKVRKARERAAAGKSAEENRVRFGRSKAERTETGASTQKSKKDLDDKRLD